MTRRWAYAAALGAGGAGSALLLAVALAAAEATDRSVSFFTRDPLAVLEAPIYTGAVSTVGVMIWWSGGIASLLAAAVLWPERRAAAQALLAGGLLTVGLAFDDLFLVHEEVLPDIFGIPEKVVYLAYAAAGAAFVAVYRRFLAIPPRGYLLALAVGLFGLSVGFDLVAPGRHALEDGMKLLGIVTWTVLFAGASIEELRGGVTTPATGPPGQARP